jgi:N-acetylglutamate synthase-like GNAT family acetyltransferase
MRQFADDAERVVTAKMAADFARAVTIPELAAATACFGRTTATRVGALPGHSAYNKARGFNADDIDHLPAICAFFTDAGLPPLLEVWAGDASASLCRRLGLAGFHAAEVNVTMRVGDGRSGLVTAPTRERIEVREVAAGEDDTIYLNTLFQGYELNHASTSIQQAMMTIEHRSPHLRRYLAYVDSRPAAAGALYITPEGAYLAGAATIPDMRQRGCQSALIQRRLHDAAPGTRTVVVTTALGSASQSNLRLHGFHTVHTRTLWRRPPDTE